MLKFVCTYIFPTDFLKMNYSKFIFSLISHFSCESCHFRKCSFFAPQPLTLYYFASPLLHIFSLLFTVPVPSDECYFGQGWKRLPVAQGSEPMALQILHLSTLIRGWCEMEPSNIWRIQISHPWIHPTLICTQIHMPQKLMQRRKMMCTSEHTNEHRTDSHKAC